MSEEAYKPMGIGELKQLLESFANDNPTPVFMEVDGAFGVIRSLKVLAPLKRGSEERLVLTSRI